ncbi:unnamed protein product, partial [Heterosigma akashiwo]
AQQKVLLALPGGGRSLRALPGLCVGLKGAACALAPEFVDLRPAVQASPDPGAEGGPEAAFESSLSSAHHPGG